MERMKLVDLLDKCKDRAYVNTHKSSLKDFFSKAINIEILRGEINTRRNFFILGILEKINFDFNKIIPNLELKKYITHYMYASMYWIFKKRHITEEKFIEIKEKFMVMKNCEKMFVDTSQNFKMTRIESDRKMFKQVKEDSNKIKDRKEEIMNLIENAGPLETSDFLLIKGVEAVDVFTVILNVDEFFDLSTLNYPEAEEGKACIGEIKKMYNTYIGPDLFSLSKLQCIDPDSDLSYEDIPEEKELCDTYVKVDKSRSIFNRKINFTLKFSNLDRVLGHRISKLHCLINQLQRNSIEVYIVSCVSLTQLLAEITFFEFTTMELCNIFSLRSNKDEMYSKIMSMITGRVVLFGENKPLKKLNTFKLDFKHLKTLVNNVKQKNRM